MEALVLPRLVQRIRAAAPQARLIIRPVDQAFNYASALENDQLDALISNWPGAPTHLKTARLISEETVCLFAADHPFAAKERITIDDYISAEHVAPVARSKADPGPIESRLGEFGLKRDIRVMMPEFNLIPYILLSSNLVFTASRHFAEHFCSLLPLRSLPAPAECGKLHYYLFWHERAHATGRHSWLRQQVMSAAKVS
jgi:DNA-binding transcriptional LysR family regulator